MEQQACRDAGAVLARKAMDEAGAFVRVQGIEILAKNPDHRRIDRHAGIDRKHPLSCPLGSHGDLPASTFMWRRVRSFTIIGNDLRGEIRMAPARKPLPLAGAAQVDHGADVEHVQQRQVGVARLHVLARAQQHSFAHAAPACHRIATIIAKIMNALRHIKRADAGAVGSSFGRIAGHRRHPLQTATTAARQHNHPPTTTQRVADRCAHPKPKGCTGGGRQAGSNVTVVNPAFANPNLDDPNPWPAS